MNESRDTLERAFEILKAPVTGMDFDVSKKRVEELMMNEFSQSRFRSRRKALLAAIVVLSVLFAGGAVAATAGAFKAIRVYIVGPKVSEHEVELFLQESGESAAVLHLQDGANEIQEGAMIELRASE